MQHEFVERRKHRRYIVSGRVRFAVDGVEMWAELVNFGWGGMLLRCRYQVPERTPVAFRVMPFRYPGTLEVAGQVVGGKNDLLAIQFLEQTEEVGILLQWLARENCPWTGGTSSAFPLPQTCEATASPLATSAPSDSQQELETTRESLFQCA